MRDEPKKIATKHLLFAAEYLKDHNATQAAIRAGYASSTASLRGHWLMKRPEVRIVIEAEERRVMLETGIDVAWVLQRLKENAVRAIEAGELAVVNRSLELIGKQIGMFVERSSINLTVDEIERVERRIVDPVRDADEIDYSIDEKTKH